MTVASNTVPPTQQQQKPLIEVECRRCKQKVWTRWDWEPIPDTDKKTPVFFDDKEGKNRHKDAKQSSYQRKQRTTDEAHAISRIFMEFAIADASETMRKHKEFNPEFDQKQVLILAEVLYKGMVELCK